MAITVNVISENNAFAVENANYATVALPITACWGPCFMLPTANSNDTSNEGTVDPVDAALENSAWSLFPAGPDGLESFIATYRGPSTNYRSTKDYSYFMALSLLNAGYAVQTCRLCPGTKASVTLTENSSSDGGSATGSLVITAKYPGTFGNNLKVTLQKKVSGTSSYWNLIGYAIDSNGTKRAVENLVFVFEVQNSTDTIVAIDELQSKFFDFKVIGTITDDDDMTVATARDLIGGSDIASSADQTVQQILKDALDLAMARYGEGTTDYTTILNRMYEHPETVNKSTAESIRFNEWIYTYTSGRRAATLGTTDGILDLLKDKINYNPNRIISSWDDQDILALDPDYPVCANGESLDPSPLTKELLEVAANSRCATAYIDVPRSLPRSRVWDDNETENGKYYGYAQKLSHIEETAIDPLYVTNSALFAPWGQYVYAGTTKQAPATPSFMALLIERAMIKNQSAQYEWALPTTRNNGVKLGQLAYTVPKALLDNWQASDGTRINTITTVPSLGTTIWGNATLFDVPVATYQALMNLSTRKLINAVKDTVYKIGIGLEFQYNGQEAYAKFFAGVTPLLDTMKNVGAIEGYKVKMAADINNIDSINANSVVGTIYLVIVGVIENITVDLIALPQGTDLAQY